MGWFRVLLASAPPVRGLTCGSLYDLLPFDRKSAERRILFADFERSLIVRAIEPRLQCVVAAPILKSNPFGRCAFQRPHWLTPPSRQSSYSYEATAGCFDNRLSLWGELF